MLGSRDASRFCPWAATQTEATLELQQACSGSRAGGQKKELFCAPLRFLGLVCLNLAYPDHFRVPHKVVVAGVEVSARLLPL